MVRIALFCSAEAAQRALRWVLGSALASALGFPLLVSGCAGCSERCSGGNQGAETCPCSSDQDCGTKLGTVLLCVEGECTVKDPPPAAVELSRCDADGACGEGFGCGGEDFCFVAPTCQRIDVDLTFRLPDGATGPVTAVRTDCEHTWSADAGADSLSTTLDIDLQGNIQADACTSGHWFAGDRVGELLCDGITWVLAPVDVNTCLGAGCPSECVLVGASERLRVCP